MNLLLSKFETYLLDEEHGVGYEEVTNSVQRDFEISQLEEFPVGFFTSL